LLEALRALWTNEEFMDAAGEKLRERVRSIVIDYHASLPYSVAAQDTLRFWQEAFAAEAPRQSDAIGSKITMRRLLALVFGVPAVPLLHLGFWVVLLTLYPRWRWLQAVVFWNPLVRKSLGLFYIDLVLLQSGFARRQLFKPFAKSFLGDVGSESAEKFAQMVYFADSNVWHRQEAVGHPAAKDGLEAPIVSALAGHHGRVLLLGNSGLGKSSFLRWSLARRAAARRDVIVYMHADQSRGGIEAQIEQRMQGFGSDQKLLHAMIYAGKIWIYIDGYNEVEIQTQEIINGFLSRYPYGNRQSG
jgi:hypothetical protein